MKSFILFILTTCLFSIEIGYKEFSDLSVFTIYSSNINYFKEIGVKLEDKNPSKLLKELNSSSNGRILFTSGNEIVLSREKTNSIDKIHLSSEQTNKNVDVLFSVQDDTLKITVNLEKIQKNSIQFDEFFLKQAMFK